MLWVTGQRCRHTGHPGQWRLSRDYWAVETGPSGRADSCDGALAVITGRRDSPLQRWGPNTLQGRGWNWFLKIVETAMVPTVFESCLQSITVTWLDSILVVSRENQVCFELIKLGLIPKTVTAEFITSLGEWFINVQDLMWEEIRKLWHMCDCSAYICIVLRVTWAIMGKRKVNSSHLTKIKIKLKLGITCVLCLEK